MITDRQTFVIQQSLLPMKQAEKLKICKMKEAWMKNDEGWMKIDEGWMKNDDFKLLGGFALRQTDRL